MGEPKINKLKIYVDYTKNPTEIAFNKFTTVLGKDVYNYNTVFPAFADKNQTQFRGRFEANYIVHKDVAYKVLTGSSVAAIRYRNSNDTFDISKSALVIHNYIDNPDLNNYPVDHIIRTTRFENLSIDNIFKNGKKIDIVWSNIKYSQSKKVYTIEWEESDKRQ